MHAIEGSFIAVDRFCKYVPVLSTLSCLTNLFIKLVVCGTEKEVQMNKGRYIRHIASYSVKDLLLFAIPVIGNFIAVFRYFQEKSNTSKPTVNKPIEEAEKSSAPSNQDAYQYLPEQFRNDREHALIACRRSAKVFEILPTEFKEDRNFILEFLDGNMNLLQFVPQEWKNDAHFQSEALKTNPALLPSFPEAWKNTAASLHAIREMPGIFPAISDIDVLDRKVILEALYGDPQNYFSLPDGLKSDQEFTRLMQEEIAKRQGIDLSKKRKTSRHKKLEWI